MKTCTRCKQEKARSTTEFRFQPHTSDRLHTQCRACERERGRAYYAKNRPNEKARAYRWRAANPERYLELQRRAYRRNPSRTKAGVAVYWAVQRGELEREPCLFCGASDVEAHHHSYAESDWLNITWLCIPHHAMVHKDARRFQNRDPQTAAA